MKVAINMDSSMGKMCLEKDVIEISSDRNEGSRDWDSPEYKDTAGSRNKKKILENIIYFNKVRPVIETLAYSDKYRKLLDEIWTDKVKLDRKIKPEEERAMVKVKGQMLKEKKDPGAFLFPIRLEG
ncbi:hypothetical protein Tco_1520559 [Tanacetum coccineum]